MDGKVSFDRQLCSELDCRKWIEVRVYSILLINEVARIDAVMKERKSPPR